ncbi:neuropeptide Y receptor Y8a [Synchiropus splendidus]|uniref:neuropeptide Y receptor Y8a n=1 Tax=Synchiropus splendidus TaxID=270530 RepID=UPI00237D604E|nr:neuropeptide Y receptor Y8a [Synchiropus splendidus]
MSNVSQPEVWQADWSAAHPCTASAGAAALLITAYSVVVTLGLLGNAGLVFVVARQHELRNVTSILIANLSCSDILMCLVCLPVTVVYTLMDSWVLGEVLCKVTPFVQCTSVTVSIFSLVLIALERHQLILHPTGWSPSAGHSYLAVGLTWLVASFISMPFLSFNILTDIPFQNTSLPARDQVICMELWPSERQRLAYTTSLLLFQYCLPLLLVLLCYLRIFLRLRRRRDMLDRGRRTRGAHRINAMLLAIVVAFALCWLPLNIFNTLFDWHHQALPDCQHDAVFSACHLTAMASTCVNPLVYGFLNSNFQREFKSRLQCGRRPAGSYQTVPLSVVGSDGTTKATTLRSPRATRTIPSSEPPHC